MTPADIRLLTEVGFLAASVGDLARATPIFRALELHRPTAAFPYAGMAVALMNGGKSEEAARVLDAAIPQVSPEDRNDLSALRGLALHLAGRSFESQRALKAAGTHRLARAMLGDAVA